MSCEGLTQHTNPLHLEKLYLVLQPLLLPIQWCSVLTTVFLCNIATWKLLPQSSKSVLKSWQYLPKHLLSSLIANTSWVFITWNLPGNLGTTHLANSYVPGIVSVPGIFWCRKEILPSLRLHYRRKKAYYHHTQSKVLIL